MGLLELLSAATVCISKKLRCTKVAKWNYSATTDAAPKATSATRFAVFATRFAVFATRLLVKIPNVGILCSQRWKL